MDSWETCSKNMTVERLMEGQNKSGQLQASSIWRKPSDKERLGELQRQVCMYGSPIKFCLYKKHIGLLKTHNYAEEVMHQDDR